MKRPEVCILRADGINCDEETFHAFENAGAKCTMVHINQLRRGEERLPRYQILALPGGFSYGDDIHSGKILAVELTYFLKEQLTEFVNSGKLIIGICNGFQVLVRTGLLPYRQLGEIKTTLMDNSSGHFECRWVNLLIESSHCIFTRGMAGRVMSAQVANSGGKFYTSPVILQDIENKGQVVFRYAGDDGHPTLSYPSNPNGSINAIAGICDSTGRIMGLMPHPERCVNQTQHPNWRRLDSNVSQCCRDIFRNAVEYVREI